MDKYKLIEPIEKRYSPMIFESRAVEQEKLDTMFEAARWAASCNNEQSWRFIYARKSDKEVYDALFDCLTEGNKAWVPTAPVLMLGIAKMNFTRNDNPNRFAMYDVGQAVSSMSIQAVSMGVYLHQMGGFSAEQAKENLHIPEGFEPAAMIAVGYPGNKELLTGKLKDRAFAERIRKPIEEIVFNRKW